MSLVEITNDYTKLAQARAVPGAYYERNLPKGGKAWVVKDPSPRSAAVLMRLFPELGDRYPELPVLRDQLLQDARPFDNATQYNKRIQAPVVERRLAAEGKSFYEYQAIDLGYIKDVIQEHSAGYIGWERGLGKTLAGAALVDALDAKRVLVVCPNTAKSAVWEAELERWLGEKPVVAPNGKPAELEQQINDARTARAVVWVVHYEAVDLVAKTRANKKGWDRLGEWDLVIVDEAHRLANPQTLWHRGLRRIKTKGKLALSGSLIQNHAEEIYGPLAWLFPKVYRSKWRDWNDRYLDYVEGGWKGKRICIGPRVDRIDEMRKELGVFMVYRRKSDELDLPKKTEQTLLVDLSPKQRAAYDELRDTYVATLDSGEQVVAIEPVVMLTRLRQVATGLSLVSDEVADSSKLDLAVDLARDADEPTVIFTWFKAAAHELGHRLQGIGCHVVTGDTTHRNRTNAIKAFQAGEGRVFVGTISTLGESVNLHRASQAIFVDRSWNPAANEQAADRIYRIGQNKRVTITYLVARGTVDELKVLPALNDKEQMRRMILGGL